MAQWVMGAVLATSVAAGCGGGSEPADGERLGSVRCDDDIGDTAIADGITTADGSTPEPGESVPAGLVDLVAANVVTEAPGTVVVTFTFADELAGSADLDAEVWRLSATFSSGHGLSVELGVIGDDDPRLGVVDSKVDGRFESRRQLSDDAEIVTEANVELRDGQGVPSPGVPGGLAEPRDGPLSIRTEVDGDTVTMRVEALDEYVDDAWPFEALDRVNSFSPDDDRVDSCEGPLEL